MRPKNQNKVYINGEFFPGDEAKVSVLDHGYLYGDGVFETLRAYEGRVFKLKEHLDRLFRSAAAIELDVGMSKEKLQEAIYDSLRVNGLTDAYIRLNVSRGSGPIGLDPDLCPEPTLIIIARKFNGYPEEIYRRGVVAITARTRRNAPESLNPEIKSTNFLNNILAKLEAKRAGADEAIMLNLDGYVCEGTVSNIFLVRDGALITPPVSAGILEGITRNTIIDIARRNLHILVEEALVEREALYQADEILLANTTFEVMPVVKVDGRPIGGGRPGRQSRMLLDGFRKLVKSVCVKDLTV